MKAEKTLRVCDKGHKYYKSSDCRSCPTCDRENKPKSGFLSQLSSPARNALLHNGIDTLEELSRYTEKEILSLHGIGPKAISILKTSLEEKGMSFKN